MNNASFQSVVVKILVLIEYGIFIIWIVLLAIKSIIHLIFTKDLFIRDISYSHFIVSFFVMIIFAFYIDGIKIRKKLLSKLNKIRDDLQREIKDQMDNIITIKLKSKKRNDKINKLAFIEKICSENQELRLWEEKQRYYQLLPNLLLALGLLGTFLGITINLMLLSYNLSDNFEFKEILEGVIGSMAIAFFSSLAALVFSFSMTKFFPSYVLDMERDKLFIFLEDYLDNEYFLYENQPNLQETIETYTTILNSFVTTLPESTKSFNNAVNDASKMLKTSADDFQKIADECSQVIQNKTTNLNSTIDKAEKIITSWDGVLKTFSEMISSIEKYYQSTDAITKALGEYTNSNLTVKTALTSRFELIKTLIDNNKKSLNKIQENLNDISNELKNNVQIISDNNILFTTKTFEITTSLDRYNQTLENKNTDLQDLADQIADSVETMGQIKIDLDNLLTSLTLPSQNP